MTRDRQVDAHGVRFGQGLVGGLLLLAIALEIRPIVPVLAGILAIGAVGGLRYAPFGVLYRHTVRPIVGTDGPREPAAPKRFAQTLGATFLSAATLGLTFGDGLVQLVAGWGLAALVAALALLAAVADFCLACRIHPIFRRFARATRPADA